MKNIIKISRKTLIFIISMLFVGTNFALSSVFAESSNGGFMVGPMNQKIVLNPGDFYEASFTVSNPINNSNNIKYELSIQPFYVNDEYKTIFENIDKTGQMAEWITFNVPDTGILAPGEKTEIIFTINVPLDAPAGGQYASIIVSSLPNDEKDTTEDGTSAMINEVFQIGHLVFAEITGETVKQGEISDVNVPSFILSGNIFGSSSIKNIGNVHGTAKYTLQVFPLFSDEEIYTNEEAPSEENTKTILPNRTLFNEVSWDETPDMGIFNVIYTVEFEGVTTQVSKLVIKCPIWLLFIIIFVIFAIIIWIVMRVKHHSKKSRKTEPTPTAE
ncbi:hypothetical protein IJJ05_02340 [Candidatus Saccharibacteria bacterium]|nr:hypothetical protein [Candidatus Saccharibacteria bacterium]